MEPSQNPKPGYRHAARLWWSFTWRWPLLALIALVPIALLVALVKPRPATAEAIAFWVSWPIVAWAQIAALRRLLRMDYKNFSVRAVERKPEGG